MNNSGKLAFALAAPAAVLALALAAFVWFGCRISVGPGEMAIVTSKTGDALPPGAILAEPGQKGVQRVPLAEGRHFRNPITHDWRIVPVTTIPAGSVGVVTSKNGRELAPGEFDKLMEERKREKKAFDEAGLVYPGTTTVSGGVISEERPDTSNDDKIPPKEGGEDAHE